MTNLDPRPTWRSWTAGSRARRSRSAETRTAHGVQLWYALPDVRRRYQAELGFEPADPRDEGKSALFGTFPPDQLPPLPNTRLLPREQ